MKENFFVRIRWILIYAFIFLIALIVACTPKDEDLPSYLISHQCETSYTNIYQCNDPTPRWILIKKD